MCLTVGRLTDIMVSKEILRMNLQTLLNERQISMYHLSKISGVPKTTVLDICSGKSSIGGCNAKTVLRLAKALNCSMEDLMEIDTASYDRNTGLPLDQTYLERGLPPYLQKSVDAMASSWKKEDRGEKDLHWDIYWCDLNADINSAEVEQEISREQANYLRQKYLRMGE